MNRLYSPLLLNVLLLLLVGTAQAAPAAEEEEEFDAVHHSADGYYLDFEPFGKVELPRIFVVRDADGNLGLNVYGSTASALRSGAYKPVFDGAHGAPSETSESGHAADAKTHDAEAPTDDHAATPAGREMTDFSTVINQGEHLEANLARAGAGHVIVDLSITRHVFFAMLGALITALLFIGLARRYKRGIGRETAPRGVFQNMMETMIVFLRDEVAKPTLGEDYRRFLPYLLTIFFFILICNLLGLVPFGATATSNIMVTAVLAAFTFFITQFSASKDHWKEVMGAHAPWWMRPIMIPIEIIGLFTKPFALAIRLFANMTAGHLVILSLIGLIFTVTNLFGAAAGWGSTIVSVGFALFMSLLEILVAFIQAYIFTILSGLFIGMAIEEHDHGEEEMVDEADAAPDEEADHSEATPHPLSSGHSDVGKRTQVESPSTEPAPA